MGRNRPFAVPAKERFRPLPGPLWGVNLLPPHRGQIFLEKGESPSFESLVFSMVLEPEHPTDAARGPNAEKRLEFRDHLLGV